ncbi:NAD(P)H-binding protein [Rhizobium sp. BR 315]|uniref:NmrA family NAD(P)-binding protein n=1 Tax=Rhizobium sp. BR 315 TaxID=3040014 RepID=UPI003D350711
MIIITAATGRYGRLVVEALLRRGVAASDVVAAVRDPAKAADLAALGVQVREADYDRPETLVTAFAGADKLLLVPSATFGQRFVQMERAINAAVEAGVSVIAYAGFINGDTSTLRLGDEHKQTEDLLRGTGVRHVLLRNGPYIEVYAGDLGNIEYALATGRLLGSAAFGQLSGASRSDLAEAAAAVLSGPVGNDVVYELGGAAFTMEDIANAMQTLTGKPLLYVDMPVDQYSEALAAGGVPALFADVIADTSFATQRGDRYTESTDLRRLLGRPSTPLIEVVESTLKRNGLL